jgi:TolA-binding protein
MSNEVAQLSAAMQRVVAKFDQDMARVADAINQLNGAVNQLAGMLTNSQSEILKIQQSIRALQASSGSGRVSKFRTGAAMKRSDTEGPPPPPRNSAPRPPLPVTPTAVPVLDEEELAEFEEVEPQP